MADGRPEVPEGYLGPQGNFKELGMSTMTHPDPEIVARDNHLEIKLQSKAHIKFTYQLINIRTDQDLSHYCFAQMKEGVLTYVVHLPEADWYKLQLFALPNADPSKSIPNIYNYLIHCRNAPQKVYPFPKHFAQWKEGCYLFEPLVLHSNSNLTNINWQINVPRAKDVAVVVNDDWFQFKHQGGPVWNAKFSLDKYRSSNNSTKVTLCANFAEGEESKYATLLEFLI